MSKLSDLSPGEMIVATLAWPFRMVVAGFVFMIQSWTVSRSGFAFLRGVPAVLAALTFLGLIWFADFYLASREEGYTLGYFQFHSQQSKDNPEYATMFAEKLVGIRPESEQYRFFLGISKEGEEDLIAARDLISELAPEDVPGFSNAHVWMAQYYSRNKDLAEDLREEKSVLHLMHALTKEPENVPALVSIADYYEKRENLEESSKYLQKLISSEIRDLRQLQAFPRYVKMKQEMAEDFSPERKAAVELGLRGELSKMLIRVEALSQRFPNEFRIWDTMVQCAILLRDYKQAQNIIRDGQQLATNEQVRLEINKLSTVVLVENGNEFKDMSDFDSFRNRLNAIALAVQGNPRANAAYNTLMEFVTLEDTDEIEYDFWLREAKLGSEAPGVIHLVIGFREIAEGNIAEGRRQWWIAEKEMLLAQTAITKMISAATYDETGNVADTKDLIAIALDLFPDQVGLYYIRGNLLMKEKNLNEAIKDFEFILTKRPNDLPAHEKLAECYKEINNIEKSNWHVAEAERIYNEMAPQQRRIYDIIKSRQL